MSYDNCRAPGCIHAALYCTEHATELGENALRARVAELEAKNARLEAEVQRLQRALAFWHPGVPAGPGEREQRAGDDAMLLCGYGGDKEPSAAELGWLRWCVPGEGVAHE